MYRCVKVYFSDGSFVVSSTGSGNPNCTYEFRPGDYALIDYLNPRKKHNYAGRICKLTGVRTRVGNAHVIFQDDASRGAVQIIDLIYVPKRS